MLALVTRSGLTILLFFQGRIHLDGPETIHSMVPLSIKGMRWDRKRRVYDTNGNRTYDLISGGYEQKELYGALRAFGGEVRS